MISSPFRKLLISVTIGLLLIGLILNQFFTDKEISKYLVSVIKETDTRNQSLNSLKKHVEEPLDPVEYWTVLASICLLVPVGGIFSGLTIGLMSLDETNLNILKRSGTPTERTWAERIEPIRKNTHLLLVTLLLANTIINESLPVLFHNIRLDGYQAVLMSTALILLFGEIIPQAICARYALAIGAFFAWPVRILMWVIFVIAYPIAKLLDFILGTQEGVIYRRAELKELVALHGEGPTSTLTKDEVGILKAVLDIRDKSVTSVMTKLEDVFMLPLEAKLSKETLEQIMEAGHSRIPVYIDHRENLIGVILVKQLLLCDPSEETPLKEFKIRKLPFVKIDMPLFDILHIFQQGGSHMALVVEEIDYPLHTSSLDPHHLKSSSNSPAWTLKASPKFPSKAYKPLGIITMEDVIEELLGQEIIDETDVYVDIGTKVKVARVIRDLEKKYSSSRLFDRKDSTEIFVRSSSHAPAAEPSDETVPLLTDEEDQNTPIFQEATHILSKYKQPSCSSSHTSLYSTHSHQLPSSQNLKSMHTIDSPKLNEHNNYKKMSNKKKKEESLLDPKDLPVPSENVIYGPEGREEMISVIVEPSSFLLPSTKETSDNPSLIQRQDSHKSYNT